MPNASYVVPNKGGRKTDAQLKLYVYIAYVYSVGGLFFLGSIAYKWRQNASLIPRLKT